MINSNAPAAIPEFPPIVLVVEDDVDTREMYELSLSHDGFWATGVGDTKDALDAARELRPDVIVTDIGLPGEIDVFSMLRTLRAQETTRHIPVIAVTGHDFSREPGLPRFAHVLLKPVSPAVLTTCIRQALQRSKELRARAARIRERTPVVVERSRRAVKRSLTLADAHPRVRRCPKCAAQLQYRETQTIQSISFDYFQPCPKGCGLFCYDRSQQRMITLIG
jgi:DNA-binding response OmpR family regulator